MLTKFKNNFRILPVFIFLAVLTLSIRVNNVFDSLKNADSRSFSISQSKAWAEEEASRDTAELGKVLEQAERGQNPGSTGEKANSTFTQSEIMILQELAERREALDLRSREIDKKAQLREYESKLKKLIGEYNEKEKEKIAALVKMYASMKPQSAARIFNTLDIETAASLLREMKPSSASAIVSQMEAVKAKAVTDEIIGNSI
jgi:flagellar motility protein MotE (MotC chaperone)